jgi:hypothetical protein
MTAEAMHRARQRHSIAKRVWDVRERYGINKAVAKWRKRTSVADLQTHSKEPRLTALSFEEEAAS